VSLWNKQRDDFVWRRCSCGYIAEPVSYFADDVAEARDCPKCGAVMKFQIKDADGCLVVSDERVGSQRNF
jgi:hypothetical protein